MIYAVLDSKSREITIASAGHLRPLLINGECSFLDIDTGMPLGLGATTYPEYKVTLDPGTQLLFYTDGITEAMNHRDEEYGAARLVEHFLNPGACVDGLIETCRDIPINRATPMMPPPSSSEADKQKRALVQPRHSVASRRLSRRRSSFRAAIPPESTNLLLAPLTMKSEDGANDSKGLGANFGTRGD